MTITAGGLIALLFWILIGCFALAGFLRLMQMIGRYYDDED